MTGLEVGLGGAFLAGLLSFLSPCILPLVPPYLCYLGGLSFDALQGDGEARPAALTRRLVVASLAFVLGFATVFVALGATASTLGQVVTRHLDLLSRVAGAVIVVLGLHFLGVFRLRFLDLERRLHLARAPAGAPGAYVVGLAFAFGWSPCVGPVLAAILLLAGGRDTVAQGAGLLAAYAAGLGLPFVLAALATRPFLGWTARARRHMRAIEAATGLLLVLTGGLIFAGTFGQMAFWLFERLPVLRDLG